MANKRSLKKQVKYICGDIAGECISASMFIEGIDTKQMRENVIHVAKLQTSTLRRANIAFDKTPRDFESTAAYNKARRQYFAAAYKSLRDSFNKEVQEVVKEMNKALPQKEK